jgi:hypothetical protein
MTYESICFIRNRRKKSELAADVQNIYIITKDNWAVMNDLRNKLEFIN